MSRFRLSLPTLRRASEPAAPNASAPGAAAANAQGQAPASQGRQHARNPMLGQIGSSAREQTSVGVPAPRNAQPSRGIVIREPVSTGTGQTTPPPRSVSDKGKAVMVDEHAPQRPAIAASNAGKGSLAHEASSSGKTTLLDLLQEDGGCRLSILGRIEAANRADETAGTPAPDVEPLVPSRLGSAGLRLAEAHTRNPDSEKADALLKQLADIAPETGEERPSSQSETTVELGARLARSDIAALAPLLERVAHAHRAIQAATEVSIAGGTASLVMRGTRDMRALSDRLDDAGQHLDELSPALDFAPAEAHGVTNARSHVEAAAEALRAIRADLAHCTLAQAIDAHELPPEASVIGELAMLSALRPAMLSEDANGHERLAQLVSRLSGGLRAMMTDALAGDHAQIREAGDVGLDVAAVLRQAADQTTELRAALPAGAAQDALVTLSNELRTAQSWLTDGRIDGRRVRPEVHLIPALHAPFQTTVATTPEAVTERMDELRRQRDALGQLPKLAARVSAEWPAHASETDLDRALNDAIANEIRRAIGPHTPIDTRIELARVAIHFAAGSDAEKARLARMLTSIALDIERPSSAQVQQTVARRDRSPRVQALNDRLGDIVADLTPEEAGQFVETLDALWRVPITRRQKASLKHVAVAVIERRRPGRSGGDQTVTLPENPNWLASARQRSRVVHDYIGQCGGPRPINMSSTTHGLVDNRTEFRKILALASNMEALRGHRHHFVAFAKELLAADDDRIENGHRPAIESAQRYDMLHALVAQLPAFGTASGDRQTVADVMSLLLQQLEKRQLHDHHKARLAKDLIEVTGHLATSRYSASDAHQSYALDAIKAGLKYSRGDALASLLEQLLLSKDNWSDKRSASGSLPRSRKQKFNAVVSTVMPPFTALSAATFAWLTAAGRSSPQSSAMTVVLRALQREVVRSRRAREEQSAAFLPLYRNLLQSLLLSPVDGKPDTEHVGRALTCLVYGTLRFAIDARDRDRLMADVTGDDPALRAALARALTAAIRDRKRPANTPLERIYAARYLQNLLAAGAGSLSEAEREAAHAAIGRAASSKSADWTDFAQLNVLLVMIDEAQRDDIPLRPEVATVAASGLLQTIQPETTLEAAGEVASSIGPMLRLYPHLDAATRARFRTALANIAPEVPAESGAAARNQLPVLSFVTSLSHFKGTARDTAELAELFKSVWPRLNETNQQAALSDMFDAYAEATPDARDALLAVIAGFGDEHRFVGAAIRLIESAFGSGAPNDIDDRPIVDVVLHRMPNMSEAGLSDLASNLVRGGSRPPQPLIDAFIVASQRLEPRSLAVVLSAELNRLGTLPAAQVEAAAARWRDIADEMDDGKEPQRDTLRLFATLASQGYADTHMQARDAAGTSTAIAVPETAASELLSALPTFKDRMRASVMRYIAGEGAPPAVRQSIVDDLFRDFAAGDAARRTLAIELGGPVAIGRAMEALARTFGVPHSRDGQTVTRPDLDQPFIASGGPDGSLTTLRSALMAPERRPEEIAVALEAIAERFSALPLAYQQQFQALFNERGRQLPAALRERVINTLALANPSLSEIDEFSEIGRALLAEHAGDGVSRVIAAARLTGSRINNGEAVLASLQRNRLKMLEPREEV